MSPAEEKRAWKLARRLQAGGHLNPGDLGLVDKLLRHEARRDEFNRQPWVKAMIAGLDEQRDRELRAEQNGRAPSRPGAAPEAAVPRSITAAHGVGPEGGGGGGAFRKSYFDARTATADELHQRLQMMGLDTTFHTVDGCTEQAREQTKSPSLGLRLKQDRVAREAEARRVQRERDLAAGAINGRDAPPEVVRQRLSKLGADYDTQASIREIPKPLPKPEEFSPLAASLEARRRAESCAREAARSGRPVNVNHLPEDVYREYLRVRGLDAPGSWGPGTGTPRR